MLGDARCTSYFRTVPEGEEVDSGGSMDRYSVGDIVKLKKPHPCGSSEWEILRVGADFRLKCQGCGHMVMVPRKLVEKNDRGLTKAEFVERDR